MRRAPCYFARMLLPHLDPDDLYDALLRRDAAYDGRVYVCVSTTGIFCRLTCPARKPRKENCTFHSTIADCLGAGFRACRKCHPTAPAAHADPAVIALMAALAAEPERVWREADIAARGHDPSTVRRSFRRHYGMTFLELARLERLRLGVQSLSQGARVIEAQVAAGYESPSAFREAMAKVVGRAPGTFHDDALVRMDWVATPLGPMIAAADARALHLLEFVDRPALPREVQSLAKAAAGSLGFGRFGMHDQVQAELDRYFGGQSGCFALPLAERGTPFERSVWRALRTIPAGQTRSYSQLADEIGRPSAVRAVARANGANAIAIVTPCHRVIGADGALTGYGGGLWRKQRLIEIERSYAEEKTGE